MDYSINIRSTRTGWWPITLLCLFKIHPHSLVTKPTFHFGSSFCLTLGSSEVDFRLPSLSEHSMAQRLGPRWSCDLHQADERKTWDSCQSYQERKVLLFLMGVTELVEHKPGTISGYLWGFPGRVCLTVKQTPKKAEPRLRNTRLIVVFEGLDSAKPKASTTPGLFRT